MHIRLSQETLETDWVGREIPFTASCPHRPPREAQQQDQLTHCAVACIAHHRLAEQAESLSTQATKAKVTTGVTGEVKFGCSP